MKCGARRRRDMPVSKRKRTVMLQRMSYKKRCQKTVKKK